MSEVMRELLLSPLFLTGLSCAVYAAARALHVKTRSFVLHPVPVSVAVLIGLLLLLDIPYETYLEGTEVISFFLGTSVVALALPLYHRLHVLRQNAPGIIAAVLAGGVAGIASALLPYLFLPAAASTMISSAPTSVTTPVAMAISELTGGLSALTAAMVVIKGIIGVIVAPLILRIVGVKNPVAYGLALGTAIHGIGIVRALEQGETQGAAASLGLCLNAMLTAAITPVILGLLA